MSCFNGVAIHPKNFKKIIPFIKLCKNRAIIWYAFDEAWLSSRGGGGVVLKTMLCARMLIF